MGSRRTGTLNSLHQTMNIHDNALTYTTLNHMTAHMTTLKKKKKKTGRTNQQIMAKIKSRTGQKANHINVRAALNYKHKYITLNIGLLNVQNYTKENTKMQKIHPKQTSYLLNHYNILRKCCVIIIKTKPGATGEQVTCVSLFLTFLHTHNLYSSLFFYYSPLLLVSRS